MEMLSSFILSVAANVVAHCIGKWLDEQFKAGKHLALIHISQEERPLR